MQVPPAFNKSFILLLALATIAFIWVIEPFWGAVFWSVVLALLFHPLQRKMSAWMAGRHNMSALITLLVILLMVVLPIFLLAMSIANELSNLYQSVQSGQININQIIDRFLEALPQQVYAYLQSAGLADQAVLRQKVSQLALKAFQFWATGALSFGQITAGFFVGFGVMLYILFFMLRDGVQIAGMVKRAIPLDSDTKQHLLRKLTTVVRATVKGNIVVAVTQGVLGGGIFWALGLPSALLWGTVMALLSLLPAVGSALIWVPVAIYLLLTGAMLKGMVLIVFGALVIGTVDNILRPILVGKDTRMPDYLVLVSTLGGISVFGLSGFVVGPLVAALFVASWDLFVTRQKS